MPKLSATLPVMYVHAHAAHIDLFADAHFADILSGRGGGELRARSRFAFFVQALKRHPQHVTLSLQAHCTFEGGSGPGTASHGLFLIYDET